MRIAFLAAFVAAPLLASELDLATVRGLARDSAAEVAVARELATARRELARSAGILLEGPAVTLEAGPRRTPEGDDSDLAVGIELPLTGAAALRAARDVVERASRELSSAAQLESRLAIDLAYVEAWQAARLLELARREVQTLERWGEVVAARVSAGAAAPFESALVGSELDAARVARAEARERQVTAWGALASLATVAPSPIDLRDPGDRTPRASGDPASPSLLERAAEARGTLERALASLETERETSRWSISSSLAREGEEEVARLGLGYRLSLRGEASAIRSVRDERIREVERMVELAKAELATRLAGARERLAALDESTTITTHDELARAESALEARLTGGKDRPSDALLLRRELVRARATALAAHAARWRAILEIEALTARNLP